MNESLFDETLDIMLKKALCEESLLFEKELEEAQVLAAQQPVKFSLEHEGKMRTFFKKESMRNKKLYQRRWIQLAAACILIFLCLVAASPPVNAARNPIVRFFAVIREKSISILTPDQGEAGNLEGVENPAENLQVQARLGYVPEGYLLQDVQDLNGMYWMIYEKADGSSITLGQFPEQAAMEMDGEDSEIKEIYLGENSYLLSHKENQYIVAWIFQDYKFNLILAGDSDEEEIKEILKNIIYF